MKIQSIKTNNTNFKGFWNNKKVLKGLEKISEHSTTFTTSVALLMALSVRPLAINATPKVDKENKKHASANSISSGLMKFALVEAVALPIERAIKKIDKNPENYLKPETIKKLQGNAKTLAQSADYKFASQILKLGVGLVTAIPKAMLTVGLTSAIVHHFKNKKEEKKGEISFTSRAGEKIAKGVGKIFDLKFFQNFSTKHKGNSENIARNLSALTDVLLTTTSAVGIARNKKIEDKRKKPLIYNNVISTGITILAGFSLDGIVKKSTNRFIEKFSEIHKNNPKLPKYLEGINILRPTLIFAGLYYGLLPVISTYLAEKTEKSHSKQAQ